MFISHVKSQLFGLPVSKKYIVRLCVSVAIFLLAMVLGSLTYLQGTSFFYHAIGGGTFSTDGSSLPSAFSVLLFGIPMLIFCYLFSDFISYDLVCSSSYVFTRISRRSKWLSGKLLQLCGFTCSYCLLGCAFAKTFLVLFGISKDPVQGSEISLIGEVDIIFLLCTVSLNTLMILAITIPLNILSIYRNAIACFITILSVHFASLLFLSSLPRVITKVIAPLVPAAQAVYAWHDTFAAKTLFAEAVIQEFSLFQSYAYLAVLIIIEVLLSAQKLKRMDFY